MWKKPYRPDHVISAAYNDGVVAIYRVTDSAQPGEMPQPREVRKAVLLYGARTIGSVRYYAAEQAQAKIDRVIRVQDPGPITLTDGTETVTAPISPQDVAVTEDGVRFRIERVERIRNVLPPTLELTLRRIDPTPEVIAP